jgi:hypothetical protein
LANIVLSPGKYLISYNLGIVCVPYGAGTSKYPLNVDGQGNFLPLWQKFFTLISSKNSENNKCILSENSYQTGSSSAVTFDLYQNSVLYEATEQETIRLNYIAFNSNQLQTDTTNKDVFWGIQNYEPNFSNQVQKTSLSQGLQKSFFVRALKLS